ncbi:hypothetical protein FPS14_contig00001-0045 [Flavobacterium psychrophilum]|nr:hypothetical protein FPS14_contig00001-0045 [Flavobacterium psychrophilum]
MNRKEFLKTCGFGCLAGIISTSILESCSTSRVLTKEIKDSNILIPITDFEIKTNKKQVIKNT